MARDLRAEGQKIALQFLERVIASAYTEGASAEQIDAYLTGPHQREPITDPHVWRARVEARKKPTLLGDIELKNRLDGRAAFRAALGLAPAEDPQPQSEAPPAVTEPCTLGQAHAVVRRWLGEGYDLDAFNAVLATIAAERLNGDPLWLLVISGPGFTKTETVVAAAGAGAFVTSTITSEGALLSGSSKKDQSKDATGGLLRKIGSRGVLVIKDMTSLLSMNRELRASVLAALREVYDGKWERNVGADGGKSIGWTGRLAVIGACTTAWDTAHSVIASMGDRFAIIRLDSNNGRIEAGRQALDNVGAEEEMREALKTAAGGVIAGMKLDPVDLTQDERERILKAADLVTRVRTAVEFDYRGEVIDAHAPEAPTRFAKQLAQIIRGAYAIGIDRDAAMNLALRCARDSVPPLRLEILRCLGATSASMTVQQVRQELDRPWHTVKRQLDALHLLGVATQQAEEVEGEDTESRPKTRWLYGLVEGVDLTVLGNGFLVQPSEPADAPF